MNCAKYILIPFILVLVACGGSKKEQKDAKESNAQNKNKTEENQQKDAEKNPKSTKIKTKKREFKGDGYTITYEVITEGSDEIKQKVHTAILKGLVYENKKYKTLDDFEKELQSKKYKVKSADCPNASREFNASINQVGEVVGLNISDYSFECGAHGNGSTIGHHFHAQSGKEITLKDVFKNEKGLKDEAEKQFCADNKLERNNSAYANAGYDGFAGGFVLAKNYFFEKDGIRFFYNPYEAGPYTLPPFDVKVSYDKVKSYMIDGNPLGM